MSEAPTSLLALLIVFLISERSSRSHSVFTLRISGKNLASGDSCEGSLNLVDLAGSERLEKSGAGNDKDRLKETQNINRSLSALGDVIAALGEKGDGKSDKHIPYRNSKVTLILDRQIDRPTDDEPWQLTYLLQHSLSGNSKTLMVLNLSPLSVHMNESLCSLRFATKVISSSSSSLFPSNHSNPMPLGEQYKHWNREEDHQGFVVMSPIPQVPLPFYP